MVVMALVLSIVRSTVIKIITMRMKITILMTIMTFTMIILMSLRL